MQLATRQAFSLEGPIVTRLRADGTKCRTLEIQGGACLVTGCRVDVKVRNSDGKLIRDSRQERLDDKQLLSDLAAKHGADTTLTAMLNSFTVALRDRNDELVHLYEVRDALASRFGNAQAAQKATEVSASDWSDLGRICNELPLRQGRHRGKGGPALRDATADELHVAETVAVALIRGYMGYLEAAQT